MILIIIMNHFRSKIINVIEAIALTKVNVYSGKKKKKHYQEMPHY